jgi:hypothetical protein
MFEGFFFFFWWVEKNISFSADIFFASQNGYVICTHLTAMSLFFSIYFLFFIFCDEGAVGRIEGGKD